MGFNLYSLIGTGNNGIFILLLIGAGIYLFLSIFLLLLSIEDKKSYEEYSTTQLVGACGSVFFNIIGIAITIIGIAGNNNLVGLFTGIIISEAVSIGFLMVAIGYIIKRKREYGEDSSNAAIIFYIVVTVIEIIFDFVIFS